MSKNLFFIALQYIFASSYNLIKGCKYNKLKSNIMRQILVEMGERKVLVKMFNTSYYTVRFALKGESQTAIAYKIRKAALERGGIEVEPKKTRK